MYTESQGYSNTLIIIITIRTLYRRKIRVVRSCKRSTSATRCKWQIFKLSQTKFSIFILPREITLCNVTKEMTPYVMKNYIRSSVDRQKWFDDGKEISCPTEEKFPGRALTFSEWRCVDAWYLTCVSCTLVYNISSGNEANGNVLSRRVNSFVGRDGDRVK